MAKINYLKGDATLPIQKPSCIVHVVNNLGVWGAGFVIGLSNRFGMNPRTKYQQWVKKEFDILGKVLFVEAAKDITIANFGAQDGLGMSTVLIRYNALEECLETLYNKLKNTNVTVHMPRIGCGLAGGKWEEVEPLIKKHITVETYVYDFK